jgi:hypothetical protein
MPYRNKKSCLAGKDPILQNLIEKQDRSHAVKGLRKYVSFPAPSPRTCQISCAKMIGFYFGMFLERLFLIDHDLTQGRRMNFLMLI